MFPIPLCSSSFISSAITSSRKNRVLFANSTARGCAEVILGKEKEKNFYKRVLNHYRKTSYNIKKLLDYLDPLLDLLESDLSNNEKTKKIYDEYLSFIPAPIVFYFDKKRSETLLDLQAEYALKLQNLSLEEELNTEEALVYFDISLPLAALFELKKKIKSKKEFK